MLTAIWFIIDEASDPAVSSMGVDLGLRAIRRLLAFSVPAARADEEPTS